MKYTFFEIKSFTFVTFYQDLVYMSVMTNFNSTINSIFGATERELLTLSLSEIIDGLMNDYKSFSRGTDAGIKIPDNKVEPRMSHSCVLYAEGLRLAQTHLDMAKKLILASIFDFNDQALFWLNVERKAKEKAEKEGKEDDFNLLDAIAKMNNCRTRALAWLQEYGEAQQLETLLKEISEFEAFKAAEREKKRLEELKLKGLI